VKAGTCRVRLEPNLLPFKSATQLQYLPETSHKKWANFRGQDHLARRRAINNIGLPEVKNYRLNKLEESYKKWKCDIERQSLVVPELKLLLALFIEDKR
jgi:hypothetical protein